MSHGPFVLMIAVCLFACGQDTTDSDPPQGSNNSTTNGTNAAMQNNGTTQTTGGTSTGCDMACRDGRQCVEFDAGGVIEYSCTYPCGGAVSGECPAGWGCTGELGVQILVCEPNSANNGSNHLTNNSTG